MSLLSTRQLAQLRAAWTAFLTDTGTILRATETRSGTGGVTQTWTASSSGPCKLLPRRGGLGVERDQAGKLVALRRANIVWPAGTDVTVRDRIAVNARTFEVLAVGARESNEVARVAACVEIT